MTLKLQTRIIQANGIGKYCFFKEGNMKTINKLLAIASLSSVAFLASAQSLTCQGIMYHAVQGGFISCHGKIVKMPVDPSQVHIQGSASNGVNFSAAPSPWAHLNDTYVCTSSNCEIDY